MTTCPVCKKSRPSDACAGAKLQCVACGIHLVDETEAQRHWRIRADKHGLFVDPHGRAYEATTEGLARRECWDDVLMHIQAGSDDE